MGEIFLRPMLLLSVAYACATEAQEVVAPRPQQRSATSPGSNQVQPRQASPVPQETQPFQWGPLTLRPHLFERFLYGSGIQSSPDHSSVTAINEFSPGFILDAGSHWSLDYTPTWTVYSSKDFNNTVEHSVGLTGKTTFEDWVLSLSQSYVSSDSPLVDTARQTSQEIYDTAINATRSLGSRMSLELTANQNFRFTGDFTNGTNITQNSANNVTETLQWSTMDWLNYQFWPALGAGIGVGGGYVDVNEGSDQAYEQIQGRLQWTATDKLSLQVQGGAEFRQFLDSGSGVTNQTRDIINPIYSASIEYQPFETTTVTLSVNATVTSSYFTDLVTERTSLKADLSQRLFGKLDLSLSGGYQFTDYTGLKSGNSGGVSAGSTAELYSFDAKLGTAFLKRGTISALYHFSHNSSSDSGFGFSSHQVGLEVGYRY